MFYLHIYVLQITTYVYVTMIVALVINNTKGSDYTKLTMLNKKFKFL